MLPGKAVQWGIPAKLDKMDAVPLFCSLGIRTTCLNPCAPEVATLTTSHQESSCFPFSSDPCAFLPLLLLPQTVTFFHPRTLLLHSYCTSSPLPASFHLPFSYHASVCSFSSNSTFSAFSQSFHLSFASHLSIFSFTSSSLLMLVLASFENNWLSMLHRLSSLHQF